MIFEEKVFWAKNISKHKKKNNNIVLTSISRLVLSSFLNMLVSSSVKMSVFNESSFDTAEYKAVNEAPSRVKYKSVAKTKMKGLN